MALIGAPLFQYGRCNPVPPYLPYCSIIATCKDPFIVSVETRRGLNLRRLSMSMFFVNLIRLILTESDTAVLFGRFYNEAANAALCA